jgi:hypothetical protein
MLTLVTMSHNIFIRQKNSLAKWLLMVALVCSCLVSPHNGRLTVTPINSKALTEWVITACIPDKQYTVHTKTVLQPLVYTSRKYQIGSILSYNSLIRVKLSCCRYYKPRTGIYHRKTIPANAKNDTAAQSSTNSVA